jgi:hypothetical protein
VRNQPHLRRAALGAQWGCTFLSLGGLSHELHMSPASAGNIFGYGLCVLGVVRVGGQGWFGEAPERSFSLVSQTFVFTCFVSHTCSKGRHQGGSLPLNVRLYIPVGCTLFVWFAVVCARAPCNFFFFKSKIYNVGLARSPQVAHTNNT